jgi:hypothetical protein
MKKQQVPQDGKVYQRKGKQYRVVLTARAKPDDTTVVVYEFATGGGARTLPLKKFSKRFHPVVAGATTKVA